MTNYRLSNLLAEHRRIRNADRKPTFKTIIKRRLAAARGGGVRLLRVAETYILLLLKPTKGWRVVKKRQALRDLTADEARYVRRFGYAV